MVNTAGLCMRNSQHAMSFTIFSLDASFGRYPAGFYRFYQCLMITQSLVRIGHGEIANGFVEYITASQVTADRGRISGPGVSTR